MSPIKFRGYGVRADDVTIIAERITHWHSIEYNGQHGTEIYLDTGKSVRVEGFPYQVEKAVRDAVSAK